MHTGPHRHTRTSPPLPPIYYLPRPFFKIASRNGPWYWYRYQLAIVDMDVPISKPEGRRAGRGPFNKASSESCKASSEDFWVCVGDPSFTVWARSACAEPHTAAHRPSPARLAHPAPACRQRPPARTHADRHARTQIAHARGHARPHACMHLRMHPRMHARTHPPDPPTHPTHPRTHPRTHP